MLQYVCAQNGHYKNVEANMTRIPFTEHTTIEKLHTFFLELGYSHIMIYYLELHKVTVPCPLAIEVVVNSRKIQ